MWNMLQIYGIYELYTHEMNMKWIMELYNEMWNKLWKAIYIASMRIEIFVKQMKYDMVIVIFKY